MGGQGDGEPVGPHRAVDGSGGDPVALRYGEHIADAAGLQVAAQLPVAAVELVRGTPGGRHPGIEGAGEHPPGQGDLGGEAHLRGDAGCGASGRVVGPHLRQVDLTVDEGRPVRRGIDQVDRHLRVLDPSGGAGVLALGSYGVISLFQVTGVVQDQHPAGVAERVDHVAAHVVTDLVGVPDRLTQQSLHRMRRTVSGLLGQLPTRPGVHIGHETEQERPRLPARLHPSKPARDSCNPVSNSASHPSASTLSPAAAARSSLVLTNSA